MLLMPAVTLVSVKVADVAPEIFDHVDPLLVDSCHCHVGIGFPLAAAVKVAVCPAFTVWSAGCVVITGAANAASIVMVIARVWFPAAFVALKVTLLFVTAAVGIPDSRPPAERLKPAGNVPALISHVIGVVPVAASCWLYPTPTLPFGSVVVVILGGVWTVRVAALDVALP